MEVADSLLDLVGNTPMVRLGRVGAGLACDLVAKVELFNPGGSVKDRPAVAMIDAAERDGLLRPGGTIVEPTSGNTGVGLAIVAAQRGYGCIFVMSDKMSDEKVALLRAYGAEVVVCPTAVPPEHPDSYYSVADRLTRETPSAFRPDQYSNPAQPGRARALDRARDLAPDRRPGHALRRRSRHRRHDHRRRPLPQGAEPRGADHRRRPRGLGVLGRNRPAVSRRRGGRGLLADDLRPRARRPGGEGERRRVVRRGPAGDASRKGCSIGGSGGTAVHAALVVGRDLGPDAVVVVLLPDSGRGYLSKIYNDEWMTRFGFLRADGPSAGDVLERQACGRRGADPIPDLVIVTTERARACEASS